MSQLPVGLVELGARAWWAMLAESEGDPAVRMQHVLARWSPYRVGRQLAEKPPRPGAGSDSAGSAGSAVSPST